MDYYLNLQEKYDDLKKVWRHVIKLSRNVGKEWRHHQFTADLGQSGSQTPGLWFIIIDFSLIIIFGSSSVHGGRGVHLCLTPRYPTERIFFITSEPPENSSGPNFDSRNKISSETF